MVKMFKYCLAFGLVLAFAAPAFAQNDYPVFQLAPGYGNLGLKGLPGRHSGFTLGTDFNFNSKAGVELFTGYYNVAQGIQLYTNTFGASATYRKSSRLIPFATAGFGFGVLEVSGLSEKSMATRIGGGVDVPFSDALALRFDATRMGFHFGHTWESGMNYSVGIVLNLSQ
jgi:hypothetical protein